MKPIAIIWLAVLAAMAGAALGLAQERLLRRGRLEVAGYADAGLERLRWVGAGAGVTLAVKAALAAEPAVAFAWVPLALVGPWAAAALRFGVRSPDRVLAITLFSTANGVVLATGFTGRAELLLWTAVGFLTFGLLALMARRLSPGSVSTAEVKVAALVGLACGTLGMTAALVAGGLAITWAALAWALGRFGPRPMATALLGSAWVAAALAL